MTVECGPTHYHACACREASFAVLTAAARQVFNELRRPNEPISARQWNLVAQLGRALSTLEESSD